MHTKRHYDLASYLKKIFILSFIGVGVAQVCRICVVVDNYVGIFHNI